MIVSLCREDIAEATGGVSPCGSFNYGLMLRLMLFIQISSLLLVLWPFLSCFPSCLLSLTGKELCS